MSDRIESILIGTAGLSFAAFVSLYLAIARSGAASEPEARDRFVRLLLVAITVESVHFVEELTTGFHHRFPEFLGLADWPTAFFVVFNLVWIALWILSAFGVRAGVEAAYFPIWFLVIGMMLNGIVHPLLALASGGYFPGLVTSPVTGVLGFVLCPKLWELTAPRWPGIL